MSRYKIKGKIGNTRKCQGRMKHINYCECDEMKDRVLNEELRAQKQGQSDKDFAESMQHEPDNDFYVCPDQGCRKEFVTVQSLELHKQSAHAETEELPDVSTPAEVEEHFEEQFKKETNEALLADAKPDACHEPGCDYMVPATTKKPEENLKLSEQKTVYKSLNPTLTIFNKLVELEQLLKENNFKYTLRIKKPKLLIEFTDYG